MNCDKKINHLSMIQQIINRMGSNSFLLKGWLVGIMVVVYTIAGNDTHKAIIITIIPLLVIWILDAYYLMLERRYRALYDSVRLKSEDEIDFDMNYSNVRIDMGEVKKYNFFNSLFSKTIFPFYLVFLITILIVYWIQF